MENNPCKRVSTDREVVELLSSWQRAHKITSIDRDLCREFIEKLPRNLDGSRICREPDRADKEHRNLARWIDLAVKKLSRSNP